MKNVLPPATRPEPTWHPPVGELLDGVCLRERWTLKFLRQIDVNKATGPDGLPARILKEIAIVIFMQLTVLCRRILREGHWPQIWRYHNICPLYKRKSRFDPLNYRGVHITNILAKIAERTIGLPLLKSFEHLNCFGDHQWAYRKHRSSRDLIAVLMCTWIFAICMDMVVGGFLSDITGAFDHVFRPYLLAKLNALGIGAKYVNFLASFFEPRWGHVVVQGKKSVRMTLSNQVFQGTVLGPPSWNIFFSDIIESVLGGKAFADDLNAFPTFPKTTSRAVIMNQLRTCQKKAHDWGVCNRVEFDADKEAFVILHPSLGEGDDFRLLGLMVDNQLRMQAAVEALLKKARPKLQALMRTRSYYDLDNMVLQYKTHVLGIVESVTAGIYHAGSSILAPLDRVQTTFVHNFNIDTIDAFMNHNLAPLSLRRDIAMLGFLHKCVLQGAHPEMETLFPRKLGNTIDGDPWRL